MKRHNQLMYLYIGVYVTSQYILKVLTNQYIIISITVIIIFHF